MLFVFIYQNIAQIDLTVEGAAFELGPCPLCRKLSLQWGGLLSRMDLSTDSPLPSVFNFNLVAQRDREIHGSVGTEPATSGGLHNCYAISSTPNSKILGIFPFFSDLFIG